MLLLAALSRKDRLDETRVAIVLCLLLIVVPFVSLATATAQTAHNYIGDFNGDGKADILWRNSTTGNYSIWLMDGSSQLAVGDLPPQGTWEIIGVGDFNGDHKADILWRNSSTGDYYIWFMDGTSVLSGGSVPQQGDWQIVAIGDFDGDGKADILWRNSSTGE